MYFIVGTNVNVHTKDHGQSTVQSRTDAVPADREHTRIRKVLPVHAMKAYNGSGGIAPLSLNFNARWKKSRPGRFNPQKMKQVVTV
jgi:hypothetical protein